MRKSRRSRSCCDGEESSTVQLLFQAAIQAGQTKRIAIIFFGSLDEFTSRQMVAITASFLENLPPQFKLSQPEG